MDKNYWLALGLALIVLMGYPFFLQWLSPKKVTEQGAVENPAAITPPSEPAAVLSPAEGPFLEEPDEPATIRHENSLYEAEFSTRGATITRLLYKGDVDQHQFTNTLFYEGNPREPGLFGVRLLHDDVDLTRAVFKLNRRGGEREIFEFIYEKPKEYRITKQFLLGSSGPSIEVVLLIENLSDRQKHFPLELTYALDYQLIGDQTAHHFEAVAAAEKIESANLDKISKKKFLVLQEISWAGLLKKYFALLVKPDWKAVSGETVADGATLRSTLRMEPISLQAGGQARQHILVYAGPQRYELLKSYDSDFENTLSRGFFGLFKIWMLLALKFCYRFTHNFGWAIILLTLAIKGVFTPLTHMSFESMKKMQALAPKLKSLQERYKGDPAKLNREMMGLYKRNKVNPVSGCLPMLLQIPIFIAFYQALSEAIELKGAPFVGWIHDLSQPDRLLTFPHALPFLGWDGLNILPILMLGSMVWQQKLTPQAGTPPEQAQVMQFMPVIFGFMFYNMPSGLVLYWFVNNMLSIIHQVFVKRMVVVLHHEDRE